MSFSGFNLGSSNTPRYGSGVNFDGIDTGATFYGQQPPTSGGVDYKALSENIKTLPPELQGKAFEDLLNRSRSQSAVTQLLDFAREARSPEARKQALQDTLEFQNAQQAAAAPYNMLSKGLDTLSKLPEQIATNAANRAMLNVLGARSATEAFNQTMASYPRSNFQSTIPLVQTKYFT
jgi:hypothetical protein